MTQPARTSYERFLPWKRSFEVGYWLLHVLVSVAFNSATAVMDARRLGLGIADWEPISWEWSSGLTWLALAWPVVWFTRRFPLHWDNWLRQLPWHLLASVAISLLHVLGMVGLRGLAYRLMGGHYDFGHWPTELFYEYLKDVRTYAGMVALIEAWRLTMRRWQGEARLLDPPDSGPPVESVERPSRFLVRKLGREFLIAAADIEWLQAAGNYVNLRVRGHDYPLRSTVAGIESRLDPARFVRIHRSYIVNLGQVTSIEPLDTGDARVHMKDGAALPASRTHRDNLRARTSDGFGGDARTAAASYS